MNICKLLMFSVSICDTKYLQENFLKSILKGVFLNGHFRWGVEPIRISFYFEKEYMLIALQQLPGFISSKEFSNKNQIQMSSFTLTLKVSSIQVCCFLILFYFLIFLVLEWSWFDGSSTKTSCHCWEVSCENVVYSF